MTTFSTLESEDAGGAGEEAGRGAGSWREMSAAVTKGWQNAGKRKLSPSTASSIRVLLVQEMRLWFFIT